MVGGRSKLWQLRAGIPIHKNVTLGNGDSTVEVTVVSLPADTMQTIDETVEEYCKKNREKVNDTVRTQLYNIHLVHHCMRDPNSDRFSVKMTDSPEEVSSIMDLEDISRIINAYQELILNKAPKLEFITQEQLDEIKKHLEVTPLSDLSTVLLVHLANCHRTIVSEK
jgi:metal-responsive CopG/Arc/MetJ family transcriptional regulator